MTYAELRHLIATRLGAFLDEGEARAEALRWMEEGLGQDRVGLVLRGGEPVPEAEEARVMEWLLRREQGEPWSYLLGWAQFRNRRFEVTRDTLIPRPETEMLLEAALDMGRRLGVRHATDVGTGSGILAVCLALETDWEIRATDISRKALKVARRNADTFGAKVDFREGSLLGPVPDPVGLVVSNPPYVDPADRPTLQRELEFEPETALYAPERGLAIATELMREARVRFAPGFVMEIGSGQGAELKARAEAMGWRRVAVHQDFAGHDRVVMGLA